MDDPLLRRIERNAVVACLAMALAAGAIAGGWAALAVIGGGVLAAASYAGVASGVAALTAAAEAAGTGVVHPPVPEGPADGDAPLEPAPRRPAPGAWTLAKVLFRYALLILLAYVMIARLRLHPAGVLVGASSVVAAAGIEAVRTLAKKP